MNSERLDTNMNKRTPIHRILSLQPRCFLIPYYSIVQYLCNFTAIHEDARFFWSQPVIEPLGNLYRSSVICTPHGPDYVLKKKV